MKFPAVPDRGPMGVWSNTVHSVLATGAVGAIFIPGVGIEIAIGAAISIADAGLYLAEGNKTGALLASVGVAFAGLRAAKVLAKVAAGSAKAGKVAGLVEKADEEMIEVTRWGRPGLPSLH